MITYKQFEELIYNWLSSKNSQNREFTFSVRRKSAKGAERDYFIGTERSGYFATTFWFLPVSFPGSSGDCISLIFKHSEKGLNYCFEFTQTKTPHNSQNISALNLCKSLENAISVNLGLQRASSNDTKMFTFLSKPKKKNYQSVEDLTRDIDAELDNVIKLVNEKIAEEKKQNPSFIAHRITPTEFANDNAKMNDRIERFKNESNESKKSEVRYWLYSPGEQAYLWEEYYENGIMALGWDNLGNLSKYESKQEIEKELQRLDNTSESRKNNAIANYDFANTVEKGDYIIVKKGRRKLLGYGIVTSDMYYDDNVDEYFNRRKVDWKVKGEWETDHDLVLKTLTDITNYREEDNKEFQHYYERLLSMMLDINSQNLIIGNYKPPLNQILYGPPGTGKTYNTVLEAARIITGNEAIDHEESLRVFKSNLDNQIEFITFHQNYSYEDFIQGLRPDTENGSALTFEKKDGVFKRIADRALKNLEASKNPASAKKEFELVFSELIKPLNDGDQDEVQIKMKKSSFYITEVGEKSIAFRKSNGDSEHTLSINTLYKMYDKGVNDIILGGLQPYYNSILELLLEKGKSQVKAVERKNYVIIIDEINRANISRVFGELITLIEDDKRSEGVIPLKVTLPSGDPFIVPSNLYIIGTMNTADKSIALLDIALRRRFEFKSMYTLYNDLEKPIHDADKLLKINEAIISRKNHDFMIGHAYFMGEDYNLEKTINTKVIPLLLEYFMNAEKEVTDILNEAGITIGGWPLKMIL